MPATIELENVVPPADSDEKMKARFYKRMKKDG